MEDENVLCACSSYEQKFYINQRFASLPESIKDELKILSVKITEDVGGIFVMQFEDDGQLYMFSIAEENDFSYDEIGGHLVVKRAKSEYSELIEQLEEYYRAFFME